MSVDELLFSERSTTSLYTRAGNDEEQLVLPLSLSKATYSTLDGVSRAALVPTAPKTRTTAPDALQPALDALMAKTPKGRCFVRPSGTEDVVRVYAEAATQAEADELALLTAQAAWTHAGGKGEMLGHFFHAEGRVLETTLTSRTLAVSLGEGRADRIIALAGGESKHEAISAVLRSGRLSGLITDERTAKALLAEEAGA